MLTIDDFETLKSQSEEFFPEVKVLAGTSFLYEDPQRSETSNADRLEALAMSVMDANAINEGRCINRVSEDVLPLSTEVVRVEELVEFQQSQSSDDSLKLCWDLVDKEKSSFIVRPDNRLL